MMTKEDETRLSNGIPVVCVDYAGSVAATYWWNQVGSADERKGEEGFAHFLEHMHFKDAAAKDKGVASTGKLAREIESRGGDINAYTSFEQTVYHVTCAEAHWESVISEFGTLARPQKFLKTDFEREREVILEELKKNQDSPDRQMFEMLFNRTFPRHAYGRPVIGYEKTLKGATVGALERFYRRTYVADRMGIILVGPLGPEGSARRRSILRAVEKRFGRGVIPASRTGDGVAAGSVPASVPGAWVRGKPSYFSKPFDIASPELAISFTVPDIRHADIPALDIAAGILGMGEMGRLYQKLFYEKKSVTSVAGGLYVPRDPGMIYFRAEVPGVDGIAGVGRGMLEEIARLGREGPTPEELERVIVHAESEKLYATQTADGTAGRIGYLRFVLGNLLFDQAYVEALKSVDAAQIKRVCAEYFNASRLTGLVMLPKKGGTVDLTALETDAFAVLGQAPAKVAKNASAAKVAKGVASRAGGKPLAEVWTRPSGIRVAHAHRPQSHVISMQAAALGGLRLELAHGETLWGASHLLSQTWAKGTRHKDTRTILTEVEGRAASLDGFSGRNTIGLQATFLSRDWSRLSGLFGEVLGEPTFPDAEVDNSKRVTEEAIRGIEDHTSQLCSKLFLETLFEHHPYGRVAYGTLDSLARIGRTELARLHAEWVNPRRLVVSVSGAVSREQVDEWIGRAIEPRLAQLAASVTPLSPAAKGKEALAEEKDLPSPRWVEKHLGREQLHLLVGGLGLRLTDDERHVLRLLQTILGGQSGRLFIELREKKSLAYTVSPISFEGLERGYVGTYIASAPSKREEALSGIRKVYEVLAQKGPTAAEMKRAKEFLLGRRAMDLQGDGALASYHGLETLYGKPILSEAEIAGKVRSITGEQVRKICRSLFVEPYQVTAAVG